MVKLQKFVVVLLLITIVLSLVSVVFNVMIFKMNSDNSHVLKQSYSSNEGNVGFIVEGSNNPQGASSG